ncbi:MAG TPA: hypothetical protein VF585_01570 [Chthoniobacterales bacterium]|jgi:hypothetical protein
MPEEQPSSPTIEQCVCERWDKITTATTQCVTDAEAYARQEPLKAIAYAAAGGYVLRILPVAAILGSVIRLVLMLLKPAALVYGAAKAYEVATKKS